MHRNDGIGISELLEVNRGTFEEVGGQSVMEKEEEVFQCLCLICCKPVFAPIQNTKSTPQNDLNDIFAVLSSYMKWDDETGVEFQFESELFPFCENCLPKIKSIYELDEQVQIWLRKIRQSCLQISKKIRESQNNAEEVFKERENLRLSGQNESGSVEKNELANEETWQYWQKVSSYRNSILTRSKPSRTVVNLEKSATARYVEVGGVSEISAKTGTPGDHISKGCLIVPEKIIKEESFSHEITGLSDEFMKQNTDCREEISTAEADYMMRTGSQQEFTEPNVSITYQEVKHDNIFDELEEVETLTGDINPEEYSMVDCSDSEEILMGKSFNHPEDSEGSSLSSDYTPNLKEWKCTICKLILNNRSAVNRHRKKVHGIGKTYSCDYCDYTDLRVDNLSKHVKRNHSKLPKEGNDSAKKVELISLEPKQTGTRIPATSSLENSNVLGIATTTTPQIPTVIRVAYTPSPRKPSVPQSHRSTGRLYKCTICYISFKNRSTLSRHRKKIHGIGKDYKCDHCEYQIDRHDSLVRHIKARHKNLSEQGSSGTLSTQQSQTDLGYKFEENSVLVGSGQIISGLVEVQGIDAATANNF